jgi:hypothetical protein
MKYHYWKCCCDFPRSGPKLDGLNDMIQDNIEITRRTFLRHADQENLAGIARNLGYVDHHRQDHGLTLAGDGYVSYHRSKYRGHRVYYLWQSSIEYIFVPRNFNENL